MLSVTFVSMLSVGLIANVGLIAVFTILVAAIVFKIAPSKADLLNRIDFMLMEYEPLDKEAFETLQREAQRECQIERGAISSWIAAEQKAVNRNFRMNDGMPRFVDRPLD